MCMLSRNWPLMSCLSAHCPKLWPLESWQPDMSTLWQQTVTRDDPWPSSPPTSTTPTSRSRWSWKILSSGSQLMFVMISYVFTPVSDYRPSPWHPDVSMVPVLLSLWLPWWQVFPLEECQVEAHLPTSLYWPTIGHRNLINIKLPLINSSHILLVCIKSALSIIYDFTNLIFKLNINISFMFTMKAFWWIGDLWKIKK